MKKYISLLLLTIPSLSIAQNQVLAPLTLPPSMTYDSSNVQYNGTENQPQTIQGSTSVPLNSTNLETLINAIKSQQQNNTVYKNSSVDGSNGVRTWETYFVECLNYQKNKMGKTEVKAAYDCKAITNRDFKIFYNANKNSKTPEKLVVPMYSYNP